jgi:opacity protein-like surface antigen
MKMTKSRILISAVAIALTSTARIEAQDANHLYFGAELGVSLQQDVRIKDQAVKAGLALNGIGDKLAFDPGVRFSAAFGYHFTDYFALEFETGSIYNNVDKIGGVSVDSVHDARLDLYQVPLLVNAIFTLPIQGPVRVYLGVGGGGTVNFWHGDLPGFHSDRSESTWAYQGLTGLKFFINPAMYAGIAYKYLGTTDHDTTQDFFGKVEGTRTHSILGTFNIKF